MLLATETLAEKIHQAATLERLAGEWSRKGIADRAQAAKDAARAYHREIRESLLNLGLTSVTTRSAWTAELSPLGQLKVSNLRQLAVS